MKKIVTILVLISCSLVSKAQTFSFTGWSRIFDNTSDTVRIVVSGLPTSIDTLFGIAHICMDITHTYDDDLLIRVVSPNGTIVTLIDNTGGSGDNFLGTCMGMDGTIFSNAAPPYGGLFQPVGNIASFNNFQNPNGTWLFIVTDQASQDTGSIHSAGLTFVSDPPRGTVTGGGGNPGPTGTIVCPTCVCPGGASGCDLLPDMTSSAREIQVNHNETPGALFISNATPNIGYGPLDIYGIDSCFCGDQYVPCGTICPDGSDIKHIVKQRIYQKVPGNDTLRYYDRIAGKMTYHAEHGHIHVDHWANYTLRTSTANPDATTWPIVGTGIKQSFCLVNLGTCSGTPGECLDNNGNTVTTAPNNGVGIHTGCGLIQGIYPGSFDVYSISLNDPIPLTGVCNGNYYIVSITDPENNFLEQDETNNWVAVPITLTQQNGTAPIITAGGPTTFCPGGNVILTSSAASNYNWSNGATTQAITVTTAGTYTVSTACGTSNATSNPITVTLGPPTPVITAGGPTTFCQGGSVTLTSSAAAGNYLWSTGATTQSITVSSAGTYTVSSTCASSTATSAPLSVTLIPFTVNASANPSTTACNGNPVLLTSSASSVGTQTVATTFTTNAQVFIPDNNATGITSPIIVSGINPATLNSTSIVSVKLNLNHTYDGDLEISLVSPSGNTIFLSNRQGASGDNFVNTVFSMSASTLISSGTAPFTGSYKPDGTFSSLTGNANGTWLLKVRDLADVDTGRVLNWTIIINTVVPETFSYSWSSVPAGFSSSQQNPAAVNPVVSTTYNVTVMSSATGCSGTKAVPVTVPALLSVNSFSPGNGSPGATITINGTGFVNVSSVSIAGVPAASFTVVNANQIQAVVPTVSPRSGVICVSTAGNCNSCSSGSFTINPVATTVSLNLRILIEGFYTGNGLMQAVLFDNNMSTDPTACDSVSIDLYQGSSPYNLVTSVEGMLHTNGNIQVTLPPSVLNNSYHIAVRHRVAIETWSKNPVLFDNSIMNFDFTSQ